MTCWTIRNDAGGFIGHVYGDRIEVPQDENGCAYVWRGDSISAGIGSRSIGVHVWERLDDGTEREVVPVPVVAPEMGDFFPVPKLALVGRPLGRVE